MTALWSGLHVPQFIYKETGLGKLRNVLISGRQNPPSFPYTTRSSTYLFVIVPFCEWLTRHQSELHCSVEEVARASGKMAPHCQSSPFFS